MSTDEQQAVGAHETEDAIEAAENALAAGDVETAVGELVEELKDTREELQEAQRDAKFAKQTAFALEDIICGEGPESYDEAGASLVVEEHGGVMEQLDELRARETTDSSSQAVTATSADILDAHRWLLDLRNNNCVDRKASQERVARLFRKFTRRASDTEDDGPQVDASGQTYSLTSTTAIEILDHEDALEDVKQESKPTVIARVLRDLQRATLDVDCQCSGVDECKHALFDFQAGRPHKVKVSKQDFEDYLQDAVKEFTSQSSPVTSSGTGEETREDARSEMEQLENAEVRR